MQYNARSLFGKRDLRKVLEERQASLIHEVDQIPPEALLEVAPKKLADALVARYSFSPVGLKEDLISIEHADQKVDVSQDGRRYIRDRSRPFIMYATLVEFFVPFDGDPELFKYKPSKYSSNAPSGRVEGNELVLAYAKRMRTQRRSERNSNVILGIFASILVGLLEMQDTRLSFCAMQLRKELQSAEQSCLLITKWSANLAFLLDDGVMCRRRT